MRIWRYAALLGALSMPAVAGAQGDPARGAGHYSLCATCHGADGAGQRISHAPRLAGQHAWYLERQILNFRHGIRGQAEGDRWGLQMATMANTLRGEQAVADVAAHAARLQVAAEPSRTLGDADPERGARLYAATCVACHGERGEGSEATGAPRLAGQHDWYLERQLDAFRAGHRGTHPEDLHGRQMRPMAVALDGAQALRDVAAHLSGLR